MRPHAYRRRSQYEYIYICFMKTKCYHLVVALVCLSLQVGAQIFPGRVYDGFPNDSAVISFASDIPVHSPINFSVSVDTTHTTLWHSGTTTKAFFNAGATGSPGIMTDTTMPYPVKANDWIGIKIIRKTGSGFLNPIVSFTHKYQTTMGKDGGAVEYSLDSLNWYNITKGCYFNVQTDSFYKATDTLPGNIPAFSGISGWKRSRFQFFQGLPLKGSANCQLTFPIWLRFRFVSDTTADTLAGWLIRSITVEQDYYAGGVNDIRPLPMLNIFPNPVDGGILSWPRLENQAQYTLRVINILGNVLYENAYQRVLNIAAWPAGTYYYRADDGSGHAYGGFFQKY